MNNEIFDFSGNEEDEAFLTENELDFLDASQSSDDTNGLILEYDSFFHSILTGVTLSHNLQKKINLLSDKSTSASFSESKTIENEIRTLTTKMFMADKTINELIIATYEFCEKENKFWHNSSLDVYKDHYSKLKGNYKDKYPGSEEIDFLKNEYLYFLLEDINGLNVIHNTIAIDDKLKLVDYVSRLNIDTAEFFNIIRQRKLDFITEEIQRIGFTVEVTKKKKVKIIKMLDAIAEIEDIDTGLTMANLPNYNLEERYEIFKQLGLETALLSLDTMKKNKNMLLALILGSSPDNAKKLLDGTYKLSSNKEKNIAKRAEIASEIESFFERNKIQIKK